MDKSETSSLNDNLIFLKLGGSLITDKSTPRTARKDTIQRIVKEISQVLDDIPQQKILLGHGSGSFGHVSAERHQTRKGVRSEEDWKGFAEVWDDAATLNRLVMGELRTEDITSIAFSPSSILFTRGGKITHWDLSGLRTALDRGMIPVIFGDVVFDSQLGGTILSTEDLFIYLAEHLKPNRILLAGREGGVYSDFPECTNLIPSITPKNYPALKENISHSGTTDVTGGMQSKVEGMLSLIESNPEISIQIFSGETLGNIKDALSGGHLGTLLHS